MDYNGKDVVLMACSSCNIKKCKHCYISYKGNRTSEELYNITKSLKNEGYNVYINGAEVLTNYEYLKSFKECQQNWLLTNGFAIYNDDSVLPLLKKNGINIDKLLDKKEKERTYKHMLNYESKLKEPTANKNVDNIFGVLIDPDNIKDGKTSIQEILKLTDEEFKSFKITSVAVDHIFKRLVDPETGNVSYQLNEKLTKQILPNANFPPKKVAFDISEKNSFKIDLDTGIIFDINIEAPIHLVFQYIPNSCEPKKEKCLSQEEKIKQSEDLNSVIEDIIQK